MAAYLQRLLDTAAGSRAEPPGLAPVVRSSSPVFEQNQLIALDDPAAEASEARPLEPPTDERRAPWQDRGAGESGLPDEPGGPALIAVPPVPTAPPPLPAEPASPAPIGRDASLADAEAPAAALAPATIVELPPQLPAARHPRPGRSEPPSSSPPRAAAAAGLAEFAQAPPASPQRPEAAAVEPADAARPGETPRREAIEGQDPALPVRPAATNDPPTIDPPASPGQRPEQPRIDLSPRPPAAPVPTDSHRGARADPAERVQPTITIGQVTVEVVEDSRPRAPAPALTAASASMIGPLGQAQAAHRLIALRRL